MTEGRATPRTPMLPSRLIRLIGRDDELQSVGALLDTHRLVTLTGQGGIGKTRLAAELVSLRTSTKNVDTYWIDLTATHPGSEPLAAFATGSGAAAQTPLSGLIDFIASRGETFLVVDNCEHVVDDAADIIERLIDGCARASILATSRLPLEIPGEVSWRLAPLRIPRDEAVETINELSRFGATALFLERAIQTAPSHRFNDVDANAIVSVCSILDGNPLAIQLAAARLPGIGLDGLHRALSRSLGILDRPTKRELTRQRSLTVSLQWSYDLLEPPTQRILRALSVLEDEFDTESAHAVAAEGPDEAETAVRLARLVDVGFVDFDPTSNSHRLLFTVRQFASAILRDSGETESAVEAHARYWVQRGSSLLTWGTRYDVGETVRRSADLRAALRWAMANDPSLACIGIGSFGTTLVQFTLGGELASWSSWLKEVRPRPEGWARAVAALSPYALMLGDPELMETLREAADIASHDQDGGVLRLLAIPAFYATSNAGNLEGIEGFLDEAERSGDGYTVMALGTQAAIVSATLGIHRRALQFADAARRVSVAGGMPYRFTAAAIAEAMVLQQRGELDAALRSPRPRGDGSPVLAAIDHAVIAGLALDRLDVGLMNEVVAGLKKLGPIDPSIGLRVGWSQACLKGNWTEAVSASVQLSRTGQIVGASVFALDAYLFAAIAYAASGEWVGAQEAIEQLRSAVSHITEPAPLVSVASDLLCARIALHYGRVADADRLVHQALQLATTNNFALVTIDALETLAVVSLARGNSRLAARLLGACSARRVAIGYANRMSTAATDEHLAAVDPALFDQAHSLTLAEAAALARRARGSRRRPQFGPESLTPTERSVAELAADGQSNQAIAQHLLMSPATVKTHLSRAFAKLGIANRSQLAGRLR